MKIIYIANARIPTEKAHGYQICKMCEEFSSAEAEIELCVPTRENPIKEDAFKYYGLKQNFKIKYIKSFDFIKYDKLLFKKSFYLQSLLFFLKLAFKKIDKNAIIYTRNPELVSFFCYNNFVVFDAHNWPETKIGLYKFFLKKVDKIICNSRGTEKKYNEHGFSNTLLAPNGVDLSEFQEKADVSKLRKKLFLPQDKKIIMYIGHLYKWKGIDSIVGAAELASEEKDVLFVVVGGTEKDVNRYDKIIKNKKLKNIIFLGHKNKNYISKFLQAADALLLPNVPISNESSEYTSPIKMFEYMASGRPIIASDLPSIREILNDKNCIFFQAGDFYDLSDKINYVLNNKEEARVKAGQANRDVLKYSWDKRAEKILKFIEIKNENK